VVTNEMDKSFACSMKTVRNNFSSDFQFGSDSKDKGRGPRNT
jgi:hypothetical protein